MNGRICLLMAALLSCACSSQVTSPLASAAQPEVKGPVRIGFAVYRDSKLDLYISGNLDRSDKLTMQYPSGGGGTLCCRELSAIAALPKQPAETVMDVETGASMLRFEAPPVKSHEPLIGVVAINAAEMRQEIDGDDVTVRAESGLLRITSCFSQEGSHLFCARTESSSLTSTTALTMTCADVPRRAV